MKYKIIFKKKITFLGYHLEGKTSDFIKHIESKGFKYEPEDGIYTGEIAARKCYLNVEGYPYLTTLYLYIDAMYGDNDLDLFIDYLDSKYKKLDSRRYKANNCEMLMGGRYTRKHSTYQVYMTFTIYNGKSLNDNIKDKEKQEFLKKNKIVIK